MKSLRVRLALSLALIVAVAIVSLVLFVRLDFDQAVRNYLFRGGMMGMENVVAQLENYYQEYGTWMGVETVLDPLVNSGGAGMMGQGKGMGGAGFQSRMMNLVLADPDGTVVYSASTSSNGQVSPASLSQGIKLLDGRQTVGYLLVPGFAAFQQGDEQPLLDLLNQAALRAALIAGAIALILVLVLSYQFLRPVQQLTKAAQIVAAGDLSHRVPVSGEDELAVLGRSFNSMASSLQQSEARRRSLTADVAHELRTPLAVQRAQVEAMVDGVYPLTPENLQVVLDQNEFLSRLVEDLRTLALADAGELRLEHIPVSLPDLVQRVVDNFGPVAQSQQIDLKVDQNIQTGCGTIQGDPRRLEQILNNLLSNALRYTPVEGNISVRLNCNSRQVKISVQDTGPGIPPESLPHIFERFYRSERARSRQEGGTGLGLAIARQLAVSHGGTLEAGNLPEGGAIFLLTLPT